MAAQFYRVMYCHFIHNVAALQLHFSKESELTKLQFNCLPRTGTFCCQPLGGSAWLNCLQKFAEILNFKIILLGPPYTVYT